MDYIQVFSQRAGGAIQISMNSASISASWLDNGWNNNYGSWMDNGWNNNYGSWSDGGWNNNYGSWSDGGWSNSK